MTDRLIKFIALIIFAAIGIWGFITIWIFNDWRVAVGVFFCIWANNVIQKLSR